MSNDQTVFGIDLGTTYSCIAYVDDYGRPTVVKNIDGQLTTPSVVELGSTVIVGEEAKKNAVLSPDAVVSMVKRHMGEDGWRFSYQGQDYTPEQISSFILKKLVGDAKNDVGHDITRVVITCPAYFGVNEREATAIAGRIAGLEVLEIINEPTAAAIAYSMEKADQQMADQVALVYDLGGGTFDVTVIEIKQGAITVIATGGDHHLGGRDWDSIIVQYLAQQWMQETGMYDDPITSPETLQDLWMRAEDAEEGADAAHGDRRSRHLPGPGGGDHANARQVQRADGQPARPDDRADQPDAPGRGGEGLFELRPAPPRRRFDQDAAGQGAPDARVQHGAALVRSR